MSELPSYPWKRNAPESMVLFAGVETSDPWVLKHALVEVVVREQMQFEAVTVPKWRLLSKETLALRRTKKASTFDSRSLQFVNQAIPDTSFDGAAVLPVPIMDACKRILADGRSRRNARIFGWKYDWSKGGYVENQVMPSLEMQGLVSLRKSSVPLVGSAKWELTPAGVGELAQLRSILETGRTSFRDWIKTDPQRASEFVELAGSAMFLLPEAGNDIRVLSKKRLTSSNDDQAIGASAITVAMLASGFGLQTLAGFDSAYFALSEQVDQAWETVHKSGGGGGVFAGGGVFIGGE